MKLKKVIPFIFFTIIIIICIFSLKIDRQEEIENTEAKVNTKAF